MDPVMRWTTIAVIFLPAAVLVARVNLRLITHHAAVWAGLLGWKGLSARSLLLWNDGHVALGDLVLSSRIWQARFGVLASLVSVMTFLSATSPRCLAVGL